MSADKIHPKIFKSYDIRGKAGEELTPEVAKIVGRALGTYFQHVCGQRQVVVGHDMRLSSEELFKGLAEGLTVSGCDVFAIGMVATPVLYHQAYILGMAGVMITGSHLAKEYNGFKVCVGLKPVFGDDIQALYSLITQGIFEIGNGKIIDVPNVNDAYRTMLASAFRQGRRLKIVVDAGNGMGGIYAGDILRRLGHEVVEIYCDPDGTFPNHHPNPEKAENMQDLAAKIIEVKADLGLAFDGDADRVGVVDEQGHHITADKVMAWLTTDILPRHRQGAIVVGDVLSSQVLFDVVDDYGGKAVMWASGHARIKSKMQAIGALIGGESSGHMFFADRYPGFDDGIYAACRVAELLAASTEPLSVHINNLPQMFTTPEYRPHCPDDLKLQVIEGVKKRLGDMTYVDVDGLRVIFADGWGLLRASGTEPVLSLRFEGRTVDLANDYKNRIMKLLKSVYPDVEDF